MGAGGDPGGAGVGVVVGGPNRGGSVGSWKSGGGDDVVVICVVVVRGGGGVVVWVGVTVTVAVGCWTLLRGTQV